MQRIVNAFVAFDRLSGAHLASMQPTWFSFFSIFRCPHLFSAEIRGVNNTHADLKWNSVWSLRGRKLPQREVMLLSWVHRFFSSTWEPHGVHITSIYRITSYVWVLCVSLYVHTQIHRGTSERAANGPGVKPIMKITFILFTLSPSNSSRSSLTWCYSSLSVILLNFLPHSIPLLPSLSATPSFFPFPLGHWSFSKSD